jgi:hypothetical protein
MSDEFSDGPLATRFALYAETGLRRAQFDVSGEQVTLFMRQHRLRALCTCGVEQCEHLDAVSRFLGESSSLMPSERERERIRSSLRPPAPPLADLEPVAAALEDLCLAVARSGLSSPDSPSIREALDQLLARVGTPPPLALSRWVARLQKALANNDVGLAARILEGARQLSDDLRSQERASAPLARRRTWLGMSDGFSADSLTEATLLEVGRVRVSGSSRAAIVRRYLLELSTGEVFKEERRKGDHDVSVGPCPRVVHVAFAELESATVPRRVRLLQYTISARPEEQHWLRVAEHATHSVRELGLRYAEGARAAPGLSEPFILFAPVKMGRESTAILEDSEGERLELSDTVDAPGADALRAQVNGGQLVWIAGRLVGIATGLVLRPVSALIRRPDALHLCRLT